MEGRMSKRIARIAPALIVTCMASLTATAPAVQAEPMNAAAAGDDCLAKPNGPSPQGRHWYYRIDRANNNRQCWYLRELDPKSGETAQTRAAPPAQPVTAPEPTPAPVEAPAETGSTPAADAGNATSVMPPTTSPPVAVAPWPSAPPVEPVRESAADQPAISPKLDIRERDGRTPKRARPTPVERPLPAERLVVEQSNHMPALLGAAFALAMIVIGSLVAHVIFSFLRRPRRDDSRHLPLTIDAPLPRMSESPSIALAPRRDITRVTVAPREQRRKRPDEPHGMRVKEGNDDPAPPAQPQTAVVIEDTVRDLLHRLRTELQLRPMTDAGARRPADRDRRL
jgi:hypothetical protein